MNTDLVILRAGRNTVHPQWQPGTPAFDLIVFAYEALSPELSSMAIETILITGPKISSWSRLFAQRPDLLDRYQQIALLDDDLLCSITGINAVFAAGRDYGLSLWQPSLSWDSYFSYGICLHNPLFRLRYVNFIELMCPFFSVTHLRLVLPLFALGYETTIDRLWCRMRRDWQKAYAIIDEVQFRHSRPVGQNAEAQGFSRDPKRRDGNMYQTVIDRTEAELGVSFKGPVSYAGITRRGKPVSGRLPMVFRTLVLLLARRHTVNKLFYKPVTDHIRHVLTRPIDNDYLDPATLKAHGAVQKDI